MFQTRCKRCLISENYPNVQFDKRGIYNYCRGEQDSKIPVDINRKIKKKEELRKDFERTVRTSKGKHYDCVIGVSGGKDSIYLLWLVKERHHLSCLTKTVDNGLLSRYAKENIATAVNSLGVYHIFLKPSSEFYRKLYTHLIKHPDNYGHMDTVCSRCSELFHSATSKIAVEKDIPLIVFGYSPDQVNKYFYEIPGEKLIKNRVPKELLLEDFTEKDRSYFWDPSNYKLDNYPRVLVPYHVIHYPNVEEIESFLRKKRLIDVLTPLLTNCSLQWLTLYLDIKKNGYNPALPNYSTLIREGKAKRWKWHLIFSIGKMLLEARLIKRREIKKTLNFLNLKLSELS